MRVAREGKGICLIDAANQDEISLGQSILDGSADLESLAGQVSKEGLDPKPVSGGQERLENIVNRYV